MISKQKGEIHFCYLNVCRMGVMMIFPFALVSDPSANVCFLIKWHSIFKIKIGLKGPSPFSESVFFNHIQESSAFFPRLQKLAPRILRAGTTAHKYPVALVLPPVSSAPLLCNSHSIKKSILTCF